MQPLTIDPIGFISTPFQQKFGIPRQPGLIKEASGVVTLNKKFDINCVRGLDKFSHIWLLFVFNETQSKGWSPLVRPPRLGGNDKIGVFSTRSTHRPNPIGMSVVALEQIYQKEGEVYIEVTGVDLLNGTPIIDIKPYISYSDSLPESRDGFAEQSPQQSLTVEWLDHEKQYALDELLLSVKQIRLIEQVIALDPRPAYKKTKDDEKVYSVAILDMDVKWQVRDQLATIVSIANQS